MKKSIYVLIMALMVGIGAKVEGATIQLPHVTYGSDVKAAVAAANDGDIIELTSSGGSYTWSALYDVAPTTGDKGIIIRAASGLASRPIITYGGASGTTKYLFGYKPLAATKNVTWSIEGIVIDGGSKAASLFQVKCLGTGSNFTFNLNNCVVQNFLAGAALFYYLTGATSTNVGDLTVTDSEFRSIPTSIMGSGALNQQPHVTNFNNCLFLGPFSGKILITGTSDTGSGFGFTVNHCTFISAASCEISIKTQVPTITNTIFANSTNTTTANVWSTGANTTNNAVYNQSGTKATIYPNTTNSLITNPNFNVSYIATNATDYVNAGTDGKTIGYYGTAVAATPTITGTATATAFTTTYGTASTKQDFTVSSSDLSVDITATAPTGFEVAINGGSYGATATITKNTSGTLSLRLKADAAVSGSYNSVTVSLESTGATTKYITTAASGNTVSAKALTITGLTGANKPYDGNSTASFTGTAEYSGLANGESHSVTGTPSASFATATAEDAKTITVTGYTAPNSNYSLTQPTLSGNITKVALTITAANQTVSYGTAAATVTGAGSYTATGFVNSEDAGVIGGTISYSTTYTNSTAAGTSGVTITPIVGSLTATNYSFTPADGTITISNALTVAAPATNISDLTLTPSSVLTVSSGGSLVIDQSTNISSVTVNGGAQLTVATGQTLTLTSLTLKSDATGTSTYKPVGTGALVVTGTTNVEQYLTYTRNYYVSSPVSNAVAPAGYTYYGRNETLSNLGWVAVSVGAGLTAGKGYIALPGTGDAPITFTTQSGGTLNTGTIPVSLTYTSAATSGKGYNLIGNPYPSHLNWTKAFTDANVAKIEPSIWYRTKVGNGNSTGWSFKTYNAFTGDAVPAETTGIIPPMQGFWVLAKQTTTIEFTDDMRSHETGNPLKAPAVNNVDRKKVRLQVSNGTRADEALLVFDANASDNYDSYDSPKMMNNATDIADIYTVADSKKLVINGLNTVKYDTEIPIGFSTGTAGDFSISANEFSNFETDAQVVLLDKELTKEFDLSKGASYNFSSGITAANANRFSLLFRAPGTTTGLNNTEKLNTQVFVNAANQITIIAPEKCNYAIYNAVGQIIENGTANSKLQTANCKLQTGIYVVKVGNETTRVIIK